MNKKSNLHNHIARNEAEHAAFAEYDATHPDRSNSKIIRTNIETILVGYPVRFVMRTEEGQALPAGICTSRFDHLVWEEAESIPAADHIEYPYEHHLGHWRARNAIMHEVKEREGLKSAREVGRTTLISNAGTTRDPNKWGLFGESGNLQMIYPVVRNGHLYIRIQQTNL